MLASSNMTVLKIARMDEGKSSPEPKSASGISFSVAALLADTRPRKSPQPVTPTGSDEEMESADEDVDVEEDKATDDGYRGSPPMQNNLARFMLGQPPNSGPIRPTPFTAFAAAAAAAAAYSAAGLPPHSSPWPGVHHFPGGPVFPSFHGPLSSSPGKSLKSDILTKNLNLSNFQLIL